jgi:thiol-disulfide isomerase/thioredoxin
MDGPLLQRTEALPAPWLQALHRRPVPAHASTFRALAARGFPDSAPACADVRIRLTRATPPLPKRVVYWAAAPRGAAEASLLCGAERAYGDYENIGVATRRGDTLEFVLRSPQPYVAQARTPGALPRQWCRHLHFVDVESCRCRCGRGCRCGDRSEGASSPVTAATTTKATTADASRADGLVRLRQSLMDTLGAMGLFGRPNSPPPEAGTVSRRSGGGRHGRQRTRRRRGGAMLMLRMPMPMRAFDNERGGGDDRAPTSSLVAELLRDLSGGSRGGVERGGGATPQLLRRLGDPPSFLPGGGSRATLPRRGIVGVYFTGSWCPFCVRFTPELARAHAAVEAAGGGFAVVVAPREKDEVAYATYRASMPSSWHALPADSARIGALGRALGAGQGIPALVLLDAATGATVEAKGRELVSERGGEGVQALVDAAVANVDDNDEAEDDSRAEAGDDEGEEDDDDEDGDQEANGDEEDGDEEDGDEEDGDEDNGGDKADGEDSNCSGPCAKKGGDRLFTLGVFPWACAKALQIDGCAYECEPLFDPAHVGSWPHADSLFVSFEQYLTAKAMGARGVCAIDDPAWPPICDDDLVLDHKLDASAVARKLREAGVRAESPLVVYCANAACEAAQRLLRTLATLGHCNAFYAKHGMDEAARKLGGTAAFVRQQRQRQR